MHFYGKAEQTAATILKAFEEGRVPKALALVYCHRKDNVPCRKWSWSNQLITALHGHMDARGYRQWQAVSRQVKKGEQAFWILVPLSKKATKTDDDGQEIEYFRTYGFKGAPVFGLSQTEGPDVPTGDPALDQWLDSLPFRRVAEAWGLSVSTFDGEHSRHAGQYDNTHKAIALGEQSLSVWAHELVHAADWRTGNHAKEKAGHWRCEVVADLGAATLLTAIGREDAADLGHTWAYLGYYAKEAKLPPIVACQRVVARTCEAVAAILDAADTPADQRIAALPAVAEQVELFA
ncbi:MAG TPA: ArdC family protein [Phycisphaerae bacterium]|nr:ArdC family protein [Phycisphaerae bacterium]